MIPIQVRHRALQVETILGGAFDATRHVGGKLQPLHMFACVANTISFSMWSSLHDNRLLMVHGCTFPAPTVHPLATSPRRGSGGSRLNRWSKMVLLHRRIPQRSTLRVRNRRMTRPLSLHPGMIGPLTHQSSPVRVHPGRGGDADEVTPLRNRTIHSMILPMHLLLHRCPCDCLHRRRRGLTDSQSWCKH